MKHPIRTGSGSLIYLALWTGIIVIHFLVLRYYYLFSGSISLLDSLVSNVLFALIAPGFWFVIRYARIGNDRLSLIATHLGTAFLSVAVWTYSVDWVLHLAFANNESYLTFLEDSLVWRTISGLMFYVISSLIFYLIIYYQEMQQRLNRELELQNLLKDTELRMLKSQINPHFIFNSLNSVSSLTITDPAAAQSMVIKLSEFLRFSLGKKSDELNSLEQEVESISIYLDIERVRFGEKLKFEKEVSEECKKAMVPNLILQPLIENAVKYGMYDNIEGVSIELNCMKVNDQLEIRLTNNFDQTAVPSKGQGIGIENVRRRLRLVYGPGEWMKIRKENGVFKVTLKLPMNP